MLTSGPHGARWTFDLSTCVPQGAAIVLGRHNLKPSTGVSSACWWLISNAFWGFEVNAIENFERILLQVKPSNRYLKLQHFDGEPCLKVLKSFSPEKSTLSPKMSSKGKTPCDPSFHLTWMESTSWQEWTESLPIQVLQIFWEQVQSISFEAWDNGCWADDDIRRGVVFAVFFPRILSLIPESIPRS